uniref:Uncharacterized protein n=1 Tax=Fagus sylvatica TaxID=28930 RepID=A0A2N9I5Y6_FAGSY
MPLSLSFSSPQNPFSFSHPHLEYAGKIALPLRWRTALISSEKSKPRAGWGLRNSSSGSGFGLKDHLKDPIALLMPRSSSR